jgi:hypothetical protein
MRQTELLAEAQEVLEDEIWRTLHCEPHHVRTLASRRAKVEACGNRLRTASTNRRLAAVWPPASSIFNSHCRRR